MDNNKNLEIISEILQGTTVTSSTFGVLYFKHLSQNEQRIIISKKKVFEADAKEKGLLSESEIFNQLLEDDMWSQEEEDKLKKYEKEIEDLCKSIALIILPSQKIKIQSDLNKKKQELSKLESEKNEIFGLTLEKYVNNSIQKAIINDILYYDQEYTQKVFDDLYINQPYKEIEIYKLQKDFFEKFSDESISIAVLSDYFAMYLPFCEDVIGVFGKPLKELTNYQLKLISYGRYFLNIFKNCSKKIPENVSKDPELLIAFYQSQQGSDSRSSNGKGQNGEGASTYFGADKNDMEFLKRENEDSVDLSEEIKKRGGSMNMKEMMELHGV
tara:strand:+ start:1934 stop:2917 length:984 start_codon:yes stop_codon:yes gene_type:complete